MSAPLTARDQPKLVFGALGPFECRWNGRAVALGGVKQQMVLALLVLEANRTVSVDRLLEWVWHEDAEPRNAATLQVYMSNWRRELAPAAAELDRALIVTRRPGYELQLEVGESDLLMFESLRRNGEDATRSGRPAEAVVAFRAALALWRGDPFSGLPVDPSATTTLRLTKVNLMEQLAEAELAVGRHRDIVGQLQTWVEEHPLNELLRAHLMLALYRCGRQADALATYRAGRELLVEELGIDPSRELREMETRILNQDRNLDLVAHPDTIDQGVPTQIRPSVLGPLAVLEHAGGIVALDRQVLTIGRQPDRGLVLDDVGVSRVHAELRRSGSSFVIVDLGSANGTVVNGRRETQHVLEDLDVIRMGSVELTFRLVPD